MARKPITTYAGGKGPRQLIWEAIRARGTEVTWTRYQIARAADIDDGTVSTYMQALIKAGIVVKVSEERISNVASEISYRLDRDEGIDAPRLRRDGSRVTQGLAQEQMWRALRLLKADTNSRELAAHAGTAAVPVSEGAAEAYLGALKLAGYLDCTREGKGLGRAGRGVQARYRLLPSRNTGPRPPMVCKLRVIYDPNEDKVVHAPAVTEEDAIYGQ